MLMNINTLETSMKNMKWNLKMIPKGEVFSAMRYAWLLTFFLVSIKNGDVKI